MALKSIRNRRSERGNVFFTLFGAVAIVGVLGAGIMATMRGPLSTMVNVNRRTQAEADMNIASKLVLLEATQGADSGDCDADGFVEPLEYKDPGTDPAPANGGHLPDEVGSNKIDPWGTPYGYCAWDAGPDIDMDACTGQNRLAGNGGPTDDTYTVIALISAGPDQTFQTTCSGGATPDVTKSAGSDDLITTFSYETAAAATGGLWSIKPLDPDTAIIDKNIEAEGAVFGGGVDLTDPLAKLTLGEGSMILPTSITLTTCNAANAGLLRVNVADDPNTLEICDDNDDPLNGPFTWESVATGAAGLNLWQQNPVDLDEIFYNVAGGNVGIGLSDPTEPLDVVGNIKLSENLMLDAAKTIVWNGAATDPTITENTGALEITSGATEVSVGSIVGVTGNMTITGTTADDTAKALEIFNNTPTSLLLVQNDGDVGIGVANPDDKLEVSGNIDLSEGYKIDNNTVLRSDTTMADTILVGNGAGGSVTGDSNTVVGGGSGSAMTTGTFNTILGAGAGATLADGQNNILIGAHDTVPVDVPLPDTDNWLNIGNLIYGDLANGRVGIGTSTLNDALEVNGTIDASVNVNADGDVTAGDDIIATGDLEGTDLRVSSEIFVDGTQFGPADECLSTEKLSWDDATGWSCIADNVGGSGGTWNLEDVLNEGNDAAGLDAEDFDQLGADEFCNEDRTQCFDPEDIVSGTTGAALSSITDAIANNTISNGAWNQTWAWQLTGDEIGLLIGESAASTGGTGAQVLTVVSTSPGSTATPFAILNEGIAHSFVVTDSPGDATPFAIDAAGNVGIGTATPGGKLHVYTTTNADGILIDGTTNPGLAFANSGTIRGYLGLATAANQYAPATVANDLAFRLNNQSLHVTTDNGATTAMTVNAGGRTSLGSAVVSDGSGGGGQNLRLDITGAAGADFYCDADGLNCFTAGSVAGTGIWERSGTVVRTRNPVVYATDDFIFGAAALDDDSEARVFFDKSSAAFRAGTSVNDEWDQAALGGNSAAFGYRTTASGDGSFATGTVSSAIGNHSTAHGYYTYAGGAGSVALGSSAAVAADQSFAFGLGLPAVAPVVSGQQSFGIFMGDQSSVDITAGNIMALLGGRLVIDPDTTSATNTNVSTGVQQLELDVQGDIGAVNYCDEAGNNCFTPAGILTGVTPRLSSIVAATADNSINNGAWNQVWNWQLTGGEVGFTFGENVASTGGSGINQFVLAATTLPASTATPFVVQNQGTSNSFVVSDQAADGTPFVIDAAGNVGIGLTAATQALTVAGTIETRGGILFMGGPDFNDNMMYLQSATPGAVDGSLGFLAGGLGSNGANDGPYFLARGNDFSQFAAQRGNIYFSAGNPTAAGAAEGSLNFWTNETSRLKVLSNGEIGIGDDTPDDGSGSGGQNLLVDIEGPVGASYYCDQNGLNCIQTSSLAGTGIWQNNSGVIRTVDTAAPWASADFVFGSSQLADTGNAAHDARMFFDKSKGAFRAGQVGSTQWDDASVGVQSFASGLGTTASGDISTAMGVFTTASGQWGMAWGDGATASGRASTAFGESTEAGGRGSLVMGHETDVLGDYSVGFGLGNPSTATFPVVNGDESFGIFMGDQSGVDITANNIMALLGGRLIIDPDNTSATNTNVSTGVQQLELDVQGDIGAVNYCDEAGNNCFTPSGILTGVTPRLSSITAAVADNSITNGAWNQTWNWQLTGAETAFKFGENAASTGGASNQYILSAETLAASTAIPLYVNNLGNGLSFRVDDGPTDATPFVIGAGGNVGIGTAAPNATLHAVEGGSVDSTVLEVSRLQTQDNDSAGVDGIGTAMTFWTETETNGTFNEFARIAGAADDADNNSRDGSLRFYTAGPNANSGAASTEKMRVTGAGNVGIGTTTPFAGWTNAPGPGLIIEGGTPVLGFLDTGGGAERWAFLAATGGFYLINDTDNTTRMFINNDGDVGINDISPDDGTSGGGQNLRLDVDGAVGGTYYCDENGLNCFTPAALSGTGIWQNNGGVVRTVDAAAPWATADFVFGASALDYDSTNAERMLFDKANAAFRAGSVGNTDWDAANRGWASVAFGESTVASGNYSTAWGANSEATDDHTFASGDGAIASGYMSTARGEGAEASGDYSWAWGMGGTIASGDYSLALGPNVAVSGNNSMGFSAGIDTGANPLVSGSSSVGFFMGDQAGVDIASGNIFAVLGGRIVLDPDTTSAANTNVSTGVQQLELDVQGDIGAVNYCDEAGNNCFTASGILTGVTPRLSSIVAATADNSINNGAWNQAWNWQLTGAETAFAFGENVASTGGGAADQHILSASTLAASTAIPLFVNNLGAGRSFQVNDEPGDTTPFVINSTGAVFIGDTSTSDPVTKLFVNQTDTGTSAGRYSPVATVLNYNPSGAAGTRQVAGIESYVGATGGNAKGRIYGVYGNTENYGGSFTDLASLYAYAGNYAAGTGGNFYAIDTYAYADNGTLTNVAALNAYTLMDAGVTNTNQIGVWVKQESYGTTTNRYGVKIDDYVGTATNDFGIYQEGGTYNYFADGVGIGTATPTTGALLKVGGTGSIIVPIGTNAQRPAGAAGMIRYNTDYATNDRLEYYDAEAGVWTQLAGGTVSNALSSITAATADNSINNGAWNQAWNWQLTGAETAFAFGENVASTGGGAADQHILSASTLAASTAIPFFINNAGNGSSFRVNDVAGDTTPFVIDAAGNVGIGTATPGDMLHIVQGASGDNGNIWIGADAAGPGDFSFEGGTDEIFYFTNLAGIGGRVGFSDGAANEFLSIMQTGRIGIGTSTPSYLLSLNGDAARTIGMERRVGGTAGNDLTILSGGAASGATDADGGELILRSGIATGTGSSSIRIQIPESWPGSGTTDRTFGDIMVFDGDLSSVRIGTNNSSGNGYNFLAGVNIMNDGYNSVGFGRALNLFGSHSAAFALGNTGLNRGDLGNPTISGDETFAVFMGDQTGVDVSANNIFAVLGGRIVLDPDNTSATNTDVSTGVQQLELDVQGDIGAINYCDEAGNNCFTPASVAASGIWQNNSGVIRTVDAVAPWATADLVFGSSQLANTVSADDDNRLFFDKSKGAFRAGRDEFTNWDDANVGNYSVAMGQNSEAPGEGAFAAGIISGATGDRSVAMGNNAYAEAYSSVAIGSFPYVHPNATHGVAIGRETYLGATALNSYGMGYYAYTVGAFSHNFGSMYGELYGDHAYNFGREISVVGDYAVGFGMGEPSGAYPVVTGDSSYVLFMGDQSGVDVTAPNLLALLGGRMVIDPDNTSAANTNVSTGVQQLELDVQGDIGAVNYCDEAGNNCFTPSGILTGVTPPLSSITAAVANNTINNGAWNQLWNWQLTGDEVGLMIEENAASTGGTGGQALMVVANDPGSTAMPFGIINESTVLSFAVGDEDADATPFVIDAAGNVGVGTAAPARKLEVRGGASFGQAVPSSLNSWAAASISGTGGAYLTIGSSTQGDWGGGFIHLGRDSGPNGGPPGTWESVFSIGAETYNVSGGDTDREFAIRDEIANVTRLFIDEGGSVMVGTTTPTAGAQLKVGGTGSIMVPVGTNAQRPTGAGGMIRYNTDYATNDRLEYYDAEAGVWTQLAGGTVSNALSSITAATATNTIDNLNYAQTWDWDTLTTQTGLSLRSDSITGGMILRVSANNNSGLSNGAAAMFSTVGASNAATPVVISNSGVGNSFIIHDDGSISDSTPVLVNAEGDMVIGATAPADTMNKFYVVGADTSTTAGREALISSWLNYNPSAAAATRSVIGHESAVEAVGTNAKGNTYGFYANLENRGSGAFTDSAGVNSATSVYNGGTGTNLYGFNSESWVDTSASITNVANFHGESLIDNGTITNQIGLWLQLDNSGGTVTNRYGIKIDNYTGSSTTTNDWGIYQEGGTYNYFADGIGIGTTTPNGPLDIAVGDGMNDAITFSRASSDIAQYKFQVKPDSIEAFQLTDRFGNVPFYTSGGVAGFGTIVLDAGPTPGGGGNDQYISLLAADGVRVTSYGNTSADPAALHFVIGSVATGSITSYLTGGGPYSGHLELNAVNSGIASPDNQLFLDSTGSVGIGTDTPNAGAALHVASTNSIIVPVGTDAQRPGTGAGGMLRYNTDYATNDRLEYYDAESATWVQLAAGSGVTTPAAPDRSIQFNNAGAFGGSANFTYTSAGALRFENLPSQDPAVRFFEAIDDTATTRLYFDIHEDGSWQKINIGGQRGRMALWDNGSHGNSSIGFETGVPGNSNYSRFRVRSDADSAYSFHVPNGSNRSVYFGNMEGGWQMGMIELVKTAGSNNDGSMEIRTYNNDNQLFLSGVGANSGFVGIGTGTPGAKLDVVTSSASGDNTAFSVTNTGIGGVFDSPTASIQQVWANPADASTILADALNLTTISSLSVPGTGSVTVDSNMLDINRSLVAGSSDTVTVTGAAAKISDSQSAGTGTLVSSNNVLEINQQTVENTGAALNVTTATTNGGLAVRINDDGTLADATPFVINQVGGVGIGTASVNAGAALHVASTNSIIVPVGTDAQRPTGAGGMFRYNTDPATNDRLEYYDAESATWLQLATGTGTTSPAAPDRAVQFNNAGVFGGSANLVYDANGALRITGLPNGTAMNDALELDGFLWEVRPDWISELQLSAPGGQTLLHFYGDTDAHIITLNAGLDGTGSGLDQVIHLRARDYVTIGHNDPQAASPARLMFFDADGGSGLGTIDAYWNTWPENILEFNTQGADDQFVLNSDGDTVGIGTDDPLEKLHVNLGNILVQDFNAEVMAGEFDTGLNVSLRWEGGNGADSGRIDTRGSNLILDPETGYVRIFGKNTTGNAPTDVLDVRAEDTDSAAADGFGANINFTLETETNDTLNDFGRIRVVADDAANNSRDSSLRFFTAGPNATSGTGSTEKVRITNSGQLFVGSTTAAPGVNPILQTASDTADADIVIATYNATGAQSKADLDFIRARGTQAAPDPITDGDWLGNVRFNAYTSSTTVGTYAQMGAAVQSFGNGLTDMFFYTTDTGGTLNERLRISSIGTNGALGIGDFTSDVIESAVHIRAGDLRLDGGAGAEAGCIRFDDTTTNQLQFSHDCSTNWTAMGSAAPGSIYINDLGDAYTDYVTNHSMAMGQGAGAALTAGSTNNLFIGESAGALINTGDWNTAVGYHALDTATSASNNTAVGSDALTALTIGTHNTAVGDSALDSATDGLRNTAVGQASGNSITTGDDNTAMGYQAMAGNNGNWNTIIGSSAMTAVGTGDFNTAVGGSALQDNTASGNTAVGDNALTNNTTGTGLVAVGKDALMTALTSTGNTAIGYQSMRLTQDTGLSNTALGYNTLTANTTGDQNVAVGYQAMDSNLGGSYNVAVGESTLQANTGGNGNTALGNQALWSNTLGNDNTGLGKDALSLTTGGTNTAVGSQALMANTSGTGSTAVGYGALIAQTTNGTQNIALGYQAGNNITTGDLNIIIGYDVDAPSATGNSQLNIGDTIYGNLTNDRIGIGTSTLSFDLSLDGTAARTIGVEQNAAAAAGQNLTIRAGVTGAGTNLAGGNLNLQSGTSTGNATSALVFLTPHMGSSGTGTNAPVEGMRLTGNTGYHVLTLQGDLYTWDNGNIYAGGNGGDNSAGDAAFAFSTDADTGMWNPAANTLAFTTNSTERIRINSSGNVGFGNFSADTVDSLVHLVGTGSTLRFDDTAGAEAGCIRFDDTTTNQLQFSHDCSTNWTAFGGASGTALSGITAATGTNTINSGTFAQEWQWNTLAGNSALTLSSTSTAATGNTQTVLNISTSGANANTDQVTFGAQVSNTHTGTNSTNVGLYATASGGNNANIALLASAPNSGTNSAPLYSVVTGGTDSAIYNALIIENSDSNSAGVDGIGVRMGFHAETETNGTTAEFGRIAAVATDASNSSKDGDMRFYQQYNNNMTESMRLNRWGAAFASEANMQFNAYWDALGTPVNRYLSGDSAFGLSHEGGSVDRLVFWAASDGSTDGAITPNGHMVMNSLGQFLITQGGTWATNNPAARLHVRDGTGTNGSIFEVARFENWDTNSAGADGIGSAITFWSETETADTMNQFARIAGIATDAANNSRDGALAFYTVGPDANSTDAAVERMRISSEGNVGIGIGMTTPNSLLHLRSQAGSSAVASIERQSNTDAAAVDFVPFGAFSPTNTPWIMGLLESGDTSAFQISNWNGTTDNIRFTIGTDGDVGIGNFAGDTIDSALHLVGTGSTLRFDDTAGAQAGCIRFDDTTTNQLQFSHDCSTSWTAFGSGGGSLGIDGLTDAVYDLATDNMRLGSDTPLFAGATGNLFIGESSGAVGTSANMDNNVGIGFQTLSSLTTGGTNTAIGSGAMQDLTTGYWSVAVGYAALGNSIDGSNNVAVGPYAMGAATTAYGNTGVGAGVLSGIVSGFGNTGVGNNALAVTTANFNTALGDSALDEATTGGGNVGIGSNALGEVIDGGGNIGIGLNAGDNITSGNTNIIIGYNIDAPNAAGDNQLNIGNTIFGDLANRRVSIVGTEPQLTVSATSGMSYMYLNKLDDTVESGIQFHNNNNFRWNIFLDNGTGNQEDLSIVGENDTDAQPRMRFVRANTNLEMGGSGGNVGIGDFGSTTSDTIDSKLHIQSGDIRLDGGIGNEAGCIRFDDTTTNQLQFSHDCSTSWTAMGSASGVALSGITAATATNTINNANYAQEWQWNTLAGTGMRLSSTSTAAAGNAQRVLEIATSGANATATQTTYGLDVSNTHTGTASTNIAIRGVASGGSADNIGVYGITVAGTGVVGSATSNGTGIVGTTDTGIGVIGVASGDDGNTVGVMGSANGASAIGMYAVNGNGQALSALGSHANMSAAVFTNNAAAGNGSHGAVGTTNSPGSAAGLVGSNTDGSNTGYGVYGYNASATGWALWAEGRTTLNGNVGIGNFAADSIDSALHLVGAGSAIRLDDVAGTEAGCIRYNDTTNQIQFSHDCTAGTPVWSVLGGAAPGSVNLDDLGDAEADYATDHNMFIGQGSGASIQPGANYNLFVGGGAGLDITTGTTNTGIGQDALYDLVDGSGNTALGNAAMLFTTSGNLNVALGAETLRSNLTGSNNVAVGHSAMFDAVSADNNVAIGTDAMRTNVVKEQNVAIGTRAMQYAYDEATPDVGNNTAVGYEALRGSATPANNTGVRNVAIGAGAMAANEAAYDTTAIGTGALALNTDGEVNVAIGSGAMGVKTGGRRNVAIGTYVMGLNETGDGNTVIGYRAGEAGVNVSGNTALGYRALLGATQGDNIAIGYSAGENAMSGWGNILLGYDVEVPVAAGNQQLNIGDTLYGTLNNDRIGIGDFSTGDTIDSALHLVGTGSELRFDDTAGNQAGCIRFDDTTSNQLQFSHDCATNWTAFGSGGNFLDLTDTPNSYSGQGGKYVRVNSGATAVEFTDSVIESVSGAPAPSTYALDDLSDVALTGPTTNQVLTYNGTNWVNSTAQGGNVVFAGGTEITNPATMYIQNSTAQGSSKLGLYELNTTQGFEIWNWSQSSGATNELRIYGNAAIDVSVQAPYWRMDRDTGNIGIQVPTGVATPTYNMSFGGNSTDKTIGVERNTTAGSGGVNFNIRAGGSGTNNNLSGGNLQLMSGISTGNGSSSIVFQTVQVGQGTGGTTRNPATSMTLASNALTIPSGATTQEPGQAGMQAAVNGMIRYDTGTNRFRAYENGAWTNMIGGGGGGGALSGITAAAADNTINNASYNQVWNWQLSGDGEIGLNILENAASTGGTGYQFLVGIATMASSTATPLAVLNEGTANSFEVWNVDNDTTPFVISNTGYVGIDVASPSVALDVAGDIEYTGTITDVSDIRLKDNIHPLSERGSMLAKLGLIDTYSFTMKGDEKGQVEFGVIAQEVEKVFPELVRTADDEAGTKSVNYVGLIAPMIEAGKELEAQNKAMKAELDALRAQQDEMKQAMSEITEDLKGLKIHTGYGISKAQMSLLMLLASLGTLSVVALARGRFGKPRQPRE